MSDQTWLTADDVAKRMKTNRKQVNAMAARGDLPGTKFGRWWRFRADLFEEYLQRRTNPDPRERTPLARARRRSA